MKLYKLWTHQKNFSEEEIVISPKDFPDIKVGDVVEIKNPTTDYSPLLVQIKSLSEPLQQVGKDVVSISQTIANIFHLQMYSAVTVNVVPPKDVALDLVELTYKEQYFSRADMWRLKKSLTNSCLYLTQKIRFCEMRTQVYELWAKGDKVTCGYVTEDTRVTFRSSTAQVNIFIQMSCEMWEFDNYGDLYFEKAVDGFLDDLFKEWKNKGCNHDVTITLFSRTFYEAKSIDEFPMHMRECIQKHFNGLFYEDFYRVVVQNEKYDDWTKTMIELRKLFHEYNKKVVQYHQSNANESLKIPKAHNSTAAEGNFLEVLNMSLNVYEKYFLDRCFDRTGKLSIVITPGPGVFEVDRQLASITKHRTIDCGNSSDLVCMGEQPLHVVPLFKFHTKQSPTGNKVIDADFNIPHWINHSFYTSRSQAIKLNRGVFIPRIKMPPLITDKKSAESSFGRNVIAPHNSSVLSDDVPFVDYDEYDAQVFKPVAYKSIPSSTSDSESIRQQRIPRLSFSDSVVELLDQKYEEIMYMPIDILKTGHHNDFMSHSFSGKAKQSILDVNQMRCVIGSFPGPVKYIHPSSPLYHKPRQALFNPFTPSRLRFKVTSNRRRWAHAFPTDPQGASVQLHHKHSGTFENSESQLLEHIAHHSYGTLSRLMKRKQRSHKISENSDVESSHHRSDGHMVPVAVSSTSSSNGSLKDVPLDHNDHEQSTLTINKGLKKVHSSGTLSATGVDSTASSLGVSAHSVEKDALPIKSAPPASRSVSFPDDYMPSSATEGINWEWGMSGEQEWTPETTTGAGMIRTLGHHSHSGLHPDLSGFSNNEDCIWVWGITGEQEWTPETKTGVDWKSMTIPASLPISTDYFPDEHALEHEYIFRNYALLPDDVNTDHRSKRSKPLTTVEVYREMTAQRLAQGFQIVMLPKQTSYSANASLSSSPYQTSSLMRRHQPEPTEEVILSIGRIFHRLTLNGPHINATMYWPRHPCKHMNYHYTYRFQVPDSGKYDVSWTDFVYANLENYNWNYVDGYLCTKGEDDFSLVESLKYWRSHFYLLPCNNQSTKKIIEGAPRCDIYEERSIEEQQQLLNNFLRLIEMLNKIRHPTQTRQQKKELTRKPSLTSSPVALSCVDKIEARDLSATTKVKVASKAQESAELTPVGSYCVTSTSNVDIQVRKTSLTGEQTTITNTSAAESGEPLCSITTQTPVQEVIEAMLEPVTGLYFVKQQQQAGLPILPNHCFIADEAVTWVINHFEDIDNKTGAVLYLQRLVDDHLIIHASGNRKHKFVAGFYLYCIPEEKKDYNMYNPDFENDWVEVATHCPISEDDLLTGFDFLDDELKEKCSYELPILIDADSSGSHQQPKNSPGHQSVASGGPPHLTLDLTAFKHGCAMYKKVRVDVDPNHKSDRLEWGMAHYHATYCPSAAYELTIQWLVATGCILGDLIQGWARKAGSFGFHLLPVPGDPFALPFTPGSDPLRGPIFVPLNIDCLKPNGDHLFEAFNPDTREERLLRFQDSILRKFGFMPDMCPLKQSSPLSFAEDKQPKYVHCTGGMFAMIPDTKTTSPRNEDGTHCKLTVGSLNDYITLQSVGTNQLGQQTDDASFYKVGFLWSWNYMLAKRWRSTNTGDESFQDKMLADFRAFCANSDNRLVEYWNTCLNQHKQKMASSSNQKSTPEENGCNVVCSGSTYNERPTTKTTDLQCNGTESTSCDTKKQAADVAAETPT